MATFTREPLSGSTSGTPIPLTSTDSAGAVVIHAGDTNRAEVYLFAHNMSTATVEAFVELGDTVSPVIVSVSPRAGLVPVLPGSFVRGVDVRGYCSTVSTSALALTGWVNKLV